MAESPIFLKLCEIKVSLCSKKMTNPYDPLFRNTVLEKTALMLGKIFAGFHIPCFVVCFARFDVAKQL